MSTAKDGIGRAVVLTTWSSVRAHCKNGLGSAIVENAPEYERTAMNGLGRAVVLTPMFLCECILLRMDKAAQKS